MARLAINFQPFEKKCCLMSFSLYHLPSTGRILLKCGISAGSSSGSDAGEDATCRVMVIMISSIKYLRSKENSILHHECFTIFSQWYAQRSSILDLIKIRACASNWMLISIVTLDCIMTNGLRKRGCDTNRKCVYHHENTVNISVKPTQACSPSTPPLSKQKFISSTIIGIVTLYGYYMAVMDMQFAIALNMVGTSPFGASPIAVYLFKCISRIKSCL